MIKQLLQAELLQSIEKYGIIKGIQRWEDMVSDMKLEVLNELVDFDIERLFNIFNF